MPETATFDHYEVLTRDDGSLFELGRGAMGITYKAFDTSLRIPVALKVINSTYLNSEVARQRFVREARSAARLRHRHVASVFHLGTEGDTWFYAMEFIDGETLDGLIKRQGTLQPIVALTITDQVARALNAATQHGLVHRDIKPANLMLVKEDDELVAKVIDFGLAKTSVAGEGEDAATLSLGGFVGTPHFASPEQLEEKEIDVRSDIYSLGVTLWYMLAGQAPFAGSMAQVMSQHLSKPPPFEKMGNQPQAVSDVLRKMLAKDPAERFQTPNDLRKAVEEAMLHLADTPTVMAPVGATPDGTVPAPVDAEENFATLLEDTSSRAGLSSFETNTIIASRYRVVESLGESNAGHVFRAYDTERQREVRLIVLHAAALADTVTLTALEREVEKLAKVKHPNLLGVYDFETVDRGSFLVLEWTDGFSLLELLKARRELNANEALALLKQAATGVDHALEHALTGLEFGLHQVQLHFPQPIEKEQILRSPLPSWPAFELKLYPLGATRNIATSQTWAGGATMVGGTEAGQNETGEARPRYLQSLAAIVYELLGGTLSPLVLRGAGGPSMRYTPLSTLSEEGNEVLKQALDPSRSFASAEEFSTALTKLDGLEVRRHESKAPLTPPPSPARSTAPKTPPPVNRPSTPPPPPFIPPIRKKAPIALIGGIAAVLTLGGGGFLFLHSSKKPSDEPPSKQHLEDNPEVTPNGQSPNIADNPPPATPVPEATPIPATPVPSTPIPATPAPATPVPGPTRQELMIAEVNETKEFEESGDWDKSLSGWLHLAKTYPESPVGKNHLESLLGLMIKRPNPLSPEEFVKLRPMITEAAELGVLSGMIVLADNIRDREWSTAFNWYNTAVDKGYPPAMTQLGLMYANGHGATPPDNAKALQYFQMAVDKRDPGGMLALGECYLAGRGLARDPTRGLELLRDAVAADNVRAMNKLGDCYSRGVEGYLPADPKEAFRLFSKAAENGSLEALGNLGVLYALGKGVPKPDLPKAIELFKKGAKAGNASCMSNYAQCFEKGMGVDKNMLQARSWYQKAASAGDRRATEWCQANKVPISIGD